MKEQQSEGLKRELGIIDVATNVINITIGSGIFLLPALVAGILGNASILAYIICGFMYMLVVLCFAEAGSRITTSGGAYTYIEKAFGPFVGFIANILFAFTGVLMIASLLNGIADMLSVPFPFFNNFFYRVIFFIICFGLLTYGNIVGVKQGMKVARTTTVLKILPLLIMVVIGLLNINTQNLHWQGLPDVKTLGNASLLLFFAFLGGETALNVSGEMKNPKRTAPIGLLIGVIVVILFYSLIQVTAQSTLGTNLNTQKAPLAAVAGNLAGTWGSRVLLFAGLVSIIGSLFSGIFVYSRIFFAGATDKLLPGYLSKLHPKYSTPYWSTITLVLLGCSLAVTGGFKQLIVLASISMLLMYAGVALAVIRFRLNSDKKYPASFTLPGGITIPILTLVVIGWFLAHSKPDEMKAALIFLALASLCYFIKSIYQNRKIKFSVAEESEKMNPENI